MIDKPCDLIWLLSTDPRSSPKEVTRLWRSRIDGMRPPDLVRSSINELPQQLVYSWD